MSSLPASLLSFLTRLDKETRDPWWLISNSRPPIPSTEMTIVPWANSVWWHKVLWKVDTSMTPFWMFGMKSIVTPTEHSLSSLTKGSWCQMSDSNSLRRLASLSQCESQQHGCWLSCHPECNTHLNKSKYFYFQKNGYVFELVLWKESFLYLCRVNDAFIALRWWSPVPNMHIDAQMSQLNFLQYLSRLQWSSQLQPQFYHHLDEVFSLVQCTKGNEFFLLIPTFEKAQNKLSDFLQLKY
jgi:hypothetical protein